MIFRPYPELGVRENIPFVGVPSDIRKIPAHPEAFAHEWISAVNQL